MTHTNTPHDAALAAAIAATADCLNFNNAPGSLDRYMTIGLFVAALSDRLMLAFPQSANALKAVVFCPPTSRNPTETPLQQTEQQQ
ncbi:hypothetical protein ACN22W_00835 [Burkholderia theae]|uniref:hypothetical protein n=1 Tax=Burkholderia theae TaxID=3143496 RepID=UPI003AFA08CF